MALVKAINLETRLAEAARAPVCALVGEDDSLRSLCLSLLRAGAAPADQPGGTVREFEGVPEARDVFDELRTAPFLGLEGRRVVVVERGDAFLSAHWERLAGYLRRPSPTGMLIICLRGLDTRTPPGARKHPPEQEAAEEGGSASPTPGGHKGDAKEKEQAAAWRAFVEALREQGMVVDCGKPSWNEARQWTRQEAQRMGNRLTPRAVDALVEALGPNLLALRTELEKLAAYVGSNATIAERDVDELVPQARWRSVFELAEAASRGDPPEALRLVNRLLMQGEKTEGIISVLALQLRRLWQVGRLHAAGAKEAEIARALGVRRFIVERAMKVLPAVSPERLRRQLDILSAADVESKTTSLRAQEEETWLENLIARLCAR